MKDRLLARLEWLPCWWDSDRHITNGKACLNGNSQTLTGNLKQTVPFPSQAHHLVPTATLKQHPICAWLSAKDTDTKISADTDYDINSARNGWLLPGKSNDKKNAFRLMATTGLQWHVGPHGAGAKKDKIFLEKKDNEALIEKFSACGGTNQGDRYYVKKKIFGIFPFKHELSGYIVEARRLLDMLDVRAGFHADHCKKCNMSGQKVAPRKAVVEGMYQIAQELKSKMVRDKIHVSSLALEFFLLKEQKHAPGTFNCRKCNASGTSSGKICVG